MEGRDESKISHKVLETKRKCDMKVSKAWGMATLLRMCEATTRGCSL